MAPVSLRFMPCIRAQKLFRLPASDFVFGFGAGGLRFPPVSRLYEALPAAFKPPEGFFPSARCHAGDFAISEFRRRPWVLRHQVQRAWCASEHQSSWHTTSPQPFQPCCTRTIAFLPSAFQTFRFAFLATFLGRLFILGVSLAHFLAVLGMFANMNPCCALLLNGIRQISSFSSSLSCHDRVPQLRLLTADPVGSIHPCQLRLRLRELILQEACQTLPFLHTKMPAPKPTTPMSSANQMFPRNDAKPSARIRCMFLAFLQSSPRRVEFWI